jgi:hypothetical protein
MKNMSKNINAIQFNSDHSLYLLALPGRLLPALIYGRWVVKMTNKFNGPQNVCSSFANLSIWQALYREVLRIWNDLPDNLTSLQPLPVSVNQRLSSLPETLPCIYRVPLINEPEMRLNASTAITAD